jgi:hypothetical protein
MEGHITMSTNELDEIQVRAQVLKDPIDKRIKTSKAAKYLGLSIRQSLRLKKKFKAHGSKSLISK